MKNILRAILFLAVFAQAMIPAGFMPNFNDAHAATAMVICSGMDQKTIYVDQSGNPVEGQDAPHSQTPCLYSVLTPSGDLPPSPFVLSAIILHDLVVVARTDRNILSAQNFTRPPAIGPPALI